LRRQSIAIALAPVDEVDEELRPGEIAKQREQQKKRELYQEANDLMHHFNRSVLDALIRCTRTTLESIKRRVSSPSTLNYGDSDEKRKMDHRPAFKVKLALAVPQVSLKPGLDEIQAALNSVVQQVVSVHKCVCQWRQGGKNQDQENLAAAAGVLGAQSRVLAAKSGVLEAPSAVLASKSGNLASVSIVAKPPLKKNFYKTVSENKEISKLISMLMSTVSSAKALVTQSLDYFKKYEELWNVEREEHMTQFMETNPDLSDFEGKMKSYVSIEEAVVEEVEQMDVGALALLTGKTKKFLIFHQF
jgi:dynein heavy chain